MKGRIGLRITSSILFLFSFILFLSGCLLQRRSVQTLEKYYDDIPSDSTLMSYTQSQRKLKQKQHGGKSPAKSFANDGYAKSEQRILSYANEISLREKMKVVGYFTTVRDMHDVCNAIMIFSDLGRLGSKGSRILAYPEEWDMQLDDNNNNAATSQDISSVEDEEKPGTKKGSGYFRKKSKRTRVPKTPGARRLRVTEEIRDLELPPLVRPPSANEEEYNTARRLLHQAKTQHNVRLLPVPMGILSPFLAFNLTDYARVLYLAHPASIVKNPDEFVLHAPAAVIAAPRGYEASAIARGGVSVSPDFMVFTPAEAEWEYVKLQRGWDSHDGEDVGRLAGKLYADSGMVLPRWPFEVRTSELFEDPSSEGVPSQKKRRWNARKVLTDAFYVLFDGMGGMSTAVDGVREEIPQPWKTDSLGDVAAPKCTRDEKGVLDCGDREAWKTLFDSFRERRMEACGLDLEA